MARKRTSHLTDAELRLMQVVWKKGPVTVADVVDSLPSDIDLAYSTVLTTMRILEEKGFLTHIKEGRAFVYHPAVGPEEARRSALRHLLSRFFGNSREQLVLNLLDDDISSAELRRLKKLVSESSQS